MSIKMNRMEIPLQGFGFDDITVNLSIEEQLCAADIVQYGSVLDAWKKHLAKFSDADEDSYRTLAYRYTKKPDVVLYIQYLRASVKGELVLNTKLIATKIAAALNTSLADFIRSDGSRKNLSEIDPIALQACKAKLKFDEAGNPVGKIDIEISSTMEVISSLTKLAEIDQELVNSLKTKTNKQTTKLSRCE